MVVEIYMVLKNSKCFNYKIIILVELRDCKKNKRDCLMIWGSIGYICFLI